MIIISNIIKVIQITIGMCKLNLRETDWLSYVASDLSSIIINPLNSVVLYTCRLWFMTDYYSLQLKGATQAFLTSRTAGCGWKG